MMYINTKILSDHHEEIGTFAEVAYLQHLGINNEDIIHFKEIHERAVISWQVNIGYPVEDVTRPEIEELFNDDPSARIDYRIQFPIEELAGIYRLLNADIELLDAVACLLVESAHQILNIVEFRKYMFAKREAAFIIDDTLNIPRALRAISLSREFIRAYIRDCGSVEFIPLRDTINDLYNYAYHVSLDNGELSGPDQEDIPNDDGTSPPITV